MPRKNSLFGKINSLFRRNFSLFGCVGNSIKKANEYASLRRSIVAERPRRLRALGLRDRPTAPGSPWQNAYVERLIGSIRRECTDHVIVLGETHLRRIVSLYASYYNEARTHLSLGEVIDLAKTNLWR